MDEEIPTVPTYDPETTAKGTGLAEPAGNEELVELALTWSQSVGLQLSSSFPFRITSTPGDCIVQSIVYITSNQCNLGVRTLGFTGYACQGLWRML